MPDDLLRRTAANRRRIADLYDTLPPETLTRESLCAGWDLRTLLGHVVMPLAVPTRSLLVAALRHRSIHRASTVISRDLGQRDVHELTALLRDRADTRVRAPGVGPMGQFADCCIHLRDAARPLGRPDDVPLADWGTVLAWLPTRQAALGTVPKHHLDGLTWHATDLGWSHGTGPVVEGPAEALALAMTGREATSAELSGDGVETLRLRLRAGHG